MKKYISYARNKVKPRLTQEAAELLQGIYVEDRSKANEKKMKGGSTIPITVRQLEAVIRLSEALTKMKLQTEVTKDEVEEAHYLFEISTMKTIEGKEFGLEISPNIAADVQKIEELIKKRMPIGNQASI